MKEGIVTTSNLRNTFKQAQKLRLQHPLPSGAYKIQEVLRHLDRSRRCIVNIGHYKKHKDSPASDRVELGRCMANERHWWLKEVPEYLVKVIGHDVLPSIEALTADGVPVEKVNKYASQARTFASEFVEDCAITHGKLKGSIKAEYANIRNGNSLTLNLIDQLELHLRNVLAETGLASH